MHFYPLKFKEIYKQYPWGGKGLERLNKEPPAGFAAESWEIACLKDGMSVVEEGPLKGRTLQELVNDYGRELVGKNAKTINSGFPIMVKFINAKKKLSIQVHPEDGYALKHENQLGKNEAWVILEADENAELVLGTKQGTDRAAFAHYIDHNLAEKCVNKVKVKAGDVIDIPAGLLHGIGEGILLAEIQQNSNVTYRVYDYDRVDGEGKKRSLHIQKALDVIDFGLKPEVKHAHFEKIGSTRQMMISNDYFAVETFNVKKKLLQSTNGESFFIYIFTEGKGSISYDNKTFEITKGDTFLIPANLGLFEISGNLGFIKTYLS